MGALYEETGDVDKAIATYRKALAVDGKQIEVRVKLVHLLQTAGELDAAIKEYEALIRAAPSNPGLRLRAVRDADPARRPAQGAEAARRARARARQDEGVLGARRRLLRARRGEGQGPQGAAEARRLDGVDPQHIVDLGDRYYQAGDKKKALETWARIKVVVPNRAKAAATLGEVYLDHDMAVEALAALREAVQLEPGNVRYKKALATALERTATSLGSPPLRYGEARALWEELLAAAGATDKLLAREARTHIVEPVGADARARPRRSARSTRRFAATPPDLEAGRLLAEVQRKLHRLAERRGHAAPRGRRSRPATRSRSSRWSGCWCRSPSCADAIEVLAQLVEVDPKRAREFYQRMAQYAAELYHDDDAIKYAARAVELSPDDAGGHQKLGEMYQRRQDMPHAIAEYRLAIAQNERLFPVYFELGRAAAGDRPGRRGRPALPPRGARLRPTRSWWPARRA